jgi:hypothetical protein
MTKRNRWLKKKARKNRYIDKKTRAEIRAWSLQCAKAIFEESRVKFPDLVEQAVAYALGTQDNYEEYKRLLTPKL